MEHSDPSDGASPIASRVHGSHIYDDLLGDQIPIQGIDQSMPDFQEKQYPSTPAIGDIAIPGFPLHSPDAGALAQSEDSGAGMLPNFVTESYQGFPSKSFAIGTSGPAIKETNRAETEQLKRSVALSDGKTPTSKYTPTRNEATNRDKVLIKEENDGDPFSWASMALDIISIPDSEDDDDVVMLQPDGRPVAIKKENDEVEFIWKKMGDRVIELDSDDEPSAAPKYNLGSSILKGRDPKGRRPPIDSTAIRKVQEAYLQKHRLAHGNSEPSSTRGVLSGLGLQNPKRSDLLVDADGSDWMNAEYTPDDKGGRIFRELKKSYNAKVKKDTNTFVDDIEFVKSEKAEKLRLARLKAEYEDARGCSDDDNSDDGLFVSPAPAGFSHSKRRAADDPNTEAEVVDLRSPKHRKSNKGSKQSQKELDREQDNNMLAGIEDYLRTMNSQEGGKSGKKGRGKSDGKVKAGKKDGAKRTKRTPNQAGYLNNSDSLLTANVYEDADANLNREALPASGHTNKQKALAALVASVPLGTTIKDANAEKNHILKSTVILGRNSSGTCKADGDNNWKLTGMKSMLRHHQVQVRNFPSDIIREYEIHNADF